MFQLLISICAFLLVITVLVTVHEFGHYWVAKKMGIKVTRFSIGFGAPLLRKYFKNNETEFVIAGWPLGGYVKMLDTRIDDVILIADKNRTYNSKTPWQRIAVLLAGPLANFIFAIGVFWLLFVVGVSALKPLVSPTMHSVAQVAGIQAGDEVIAVNGHAVTSFEEFVTQLYAEILKLSPDQKSTQLDTSAVDLMVFNAGSKRVVRLPIAKELTRLEQTSLLLNQLGITSWRPPLPAIIGKVSANSPASAVGLKSGDKIVQLDDVKIDNWTQLVALIQPYPNETKTIYYLRDNERQNLAIKIGEQASNGRTVGIIGVSVAIPENFTEQLQTRQQYAVFAALGKALNKTWDMSVLSLTMFKEMLKGNVSLKNLSGPVSIAEQAGYSVQSGIDRYIAFFALISIALGIVNLLPIPMLDGGQIVLNVLELGKGSPVSERIEITYQQIGFICIVLMMGLAIFNDLERLLM